MMRAHLLVLNHFGLHGYLYSKCRYFEFNARIGGTHIFKKESPYSNRDVHLCNFDFESSASPLEIYYQVVTCNQSGNTMISYR